MHVPSAAARDRVLEALLTITATRGVEGVSVREVAAAAEVSIGTVQYYCHSKNQMLRMAFEETNERILARARAIERSGSVGGVLRRALQEFLPLDDRRRVEAGVYLAFSARAAVSADLSAVRHAMIAEQHRICADALRLAQARGEALRAFDADEVARATVAMVDGVLLNRLSDPGGWSAEGCVSMLDQHLGSYVRLRRP